MAMMSDRKYDTAYRDFKTRFKGDVERNLRLWAREWFIGVYGEKALRIHIGKGLSMVSFERLALLALFDAKFNREKAKSGGRVTKPTT